MGSMFGLSLGLLAALTFSPAARKPEPSAHLLQLAKTCQEQRGIAAKAFVRHLKRSERGHLGWSVVLQGKATEARGDMAKKIATAAGAKLTPVDTARLAGRNAAEAKQNLEELFANARTGNWILFFDEADSLFGQRSSVADSHDRYANLEVSHLLERVVAHGDLVLIGTQKTPPAEGGAKALRDVVVAVGSKDAKSGGVASVVPWTKLCWPPR